VEGARFQGRASVAEEGGPIWRFRAEGGGRLVLSEADLVALVRGSELIRRDLEEWRRDLCQPLCL